MSRLSIRRLAILTCAVWVVAVPAFANPNQLVITGAVPNFDDSILTIVGANFGTGAPAVTLGGLSMTLQAYSESEIVADLGTLGQGSYLLVVSKGNGASKNDDFVLTIGAGAASGDITSVAAGDGLSGGGTAGDVSLELDFAVLDSKYARLDLDNYFSENQFVPNLSAQFDVSAENLAASANVSGETAVFDTSVPGNTTLIVHQSAAHDGNAISAEAHGENQVAMSANSTAQTGQNVAVQGIVESPDAIAGVFLNQADGRLITASTPTYGEVFRLGGEGRLNVSTGFTPDPGDQIFVVDVLATATSGHVRGVNSTTFSPESAAVVGSAQASSDGVGGLFDSYGVDGVGVQGLAQASSGSGIGVFGATESAGGAAGFFANNAGGSILIGKSNLGEVFYVDGTGAVFASGYFDSFGNPIGNDGIGVSQIDTGAGLAGGSITDTGTIEIDEGYLDGLYLRTDGGNGGPFARLDQPNNLTGDQRTDGSFIAERAIDEAPAIQGRSFSPGFGIGLLGETNGTEGIALYGRSYSETGGTLGLHAVVHSPDGVAGDFHNEADGRLLSAGTPTNGEVMSLDGSGMMNVRQLGASSDYVPGSGDQIFIIDGRASATSGHTRAINGTTFSPDSSAVVGSAQPTLGGIGGSFDSRGIDGVGVQGIAQASSGFSNGVFGVTESPDGVGGFFANSAGGSILLGSSNLGEVFRVDGTGAVFASSYFDGFGNPIGNDGIGVSQIDTGAGLAGGSITDTGTIEIDEGYLDGLYLRTDGGNGGPFARLDQPNNLTGDQRTDGSFIAERAIDEAPAIQGRSFAPGFGIGLLGETNGTEGIALYGRSYSETGGTLGLHAVVHSPDGVAGVFHNEADGTLLSAGTPTYGEVFRVEGDGLVSTRRVLANNPEDGDNAMHAVTWGSGSTSVWGSNDSPDFGTGVHGRTSAPDGQGVWAETTSSSGNARALMAAANNPDGVAAVINHNAGGQIISAGSNDGGEVMRLEQDGTLRAVAFTDLAGNPVGGISQIDTGPGLSGGPITGIGTIEVDFAAFDGNYARLDAENSFSEPQHSPRFEAFNSDPDGVAIEGTGAGSGFSIGVRGATFSSDGGGIWGDAAAAGPGGAVGVLGTTSGEGGSAIEGYAGSPTGSANGIRGVVESPDAVAGAFQNNGDGTVLSAASASWGEVFRVGGEGRVGVVTGFTPDPGDQIFVVDVLATATSGHVRGVNSTTFSAESAAVVGSSQPTIGGTGGSFDTYGEGGTGVWAGAQATTGGGRALVAQNWSPDGISGSFQNLGDGQILSGNNSNAEVFRVEGDGTVRAAAFTDLVGDPIGGISQIDTGAGLSGGPITDIGTIEVDFGVFDNQYARLHTANVFDEDNLFLGNVSVTQASAPGASVMGVVNATDGAIGLQAEATGPGSRALVAFGDIGLQAGGGSVGVSGFTYEPDSIGVAADALNSSGNGIGLVAGAASPTGLSAMLTSNGGRLLEGMANQIATGNPETVVAVEADGSIVQNGFGSALQVGNVWNTGTSSFDEVYRVDADGTITATAVIETSSQRFKTNISSLSGALATIQNLRGVSFDWKRDGQHDIGLIAEEVAEVLPEVVASVDGEAQGVNYGRLTALLIEAVKEQQAHIERLEAMIERQLAAR